MRLLETTFRARSNRMTKAVHPPVHGLLLTIGRPQADYSNADHFALASLFCAGTGLAIRRFGIPVKMAAQPVAGHVQPALDGADRRLEFAAHLLQRTAVNVERHQRRAVHRLEPVQSGPELSLLLHADQLVQRAHRRSLYVLQDRGLGIADRTTPRQ